jgi:hypothetical protein
MLNFQQQNAAGTSVRHSVAKLRHFRAADILLVRPPSFSNCDPRNAIQHPASRPRTASAGAILGAPISWRAWEGLERANVGRPDNRVLEEFSLQPKLQPQLMTFNSSEPRFNVKRRGQMQCLPRKVEITFQSTDECLLYFGNWDNRAEFRPTPTPPAPGGAENIWGNGTQGSLTDSATLG